MTVIPTGGPKARSGGIYSEGLALSSQCLKGNSLLKAINGRQAKGNPDPPPKRSCRFAKIAVQFPRRAGVSFVPVPNPEDGPIP